MAVFLNAKNAEIFSNQIQELRELNEQLNVVLEDFRTGRMTTKRAQVFANGGYEAGKEFSTKLIAIIGALEDGCKDLKKLCKVSDDYVKEHKRISKNK